MLAGSAQESISVSSRLVSQLPSKVCMYFVHCTLWQAGKCLITKSNQTYSIPSPEGSEFWHKASIIPSPESFGYSTDFVFGHTASVFGLKLHHTLSRAFWLLDIKPLYHTLPGGFWLLYNICIQYYVQYYSKLRGTSITITVTELTY